MPAFAAALFAVFLTGTAAWITHVVVCLKVLFSGASVSIGYAMLLALGAIVPPIGAIHGVGVWMGIW